MPASSFAVTQPSSPVPCVPMALASPRGRRAVALWASVGLTLAASGALYAEDVASALRASPESSSQAPSQAPTPPAVKPEGSPPAERRRAAPAATSEFPANWFFNGAIARFSSMIGKPPPALRVRDWPDQEVDPRAQIGKVVVIDFWGTWCGPCVRGIPHLVSLVEKHKESGDLVVIGVHDGQRGWQSMGQVAQNLKINYPICIDKFEPGMSSGESAASYRVGFWPTIVVVDRAGKVRAAGLQSEFVDEVVEKLLKEPAPAAATEGAAGTGQGDAATPAPARQAPPPPPKPLDIQDITTYAEGDATRLAKLKALIGKSPSEIASPEWINTKPLTFEGLKGKWVLLDFWATWCDPCKEAIPAYNALQAKYKDSLVILGVCQARGAEHMWLVAKEKGIEYPIVRLMSDALMTELEIDNLPDYVLIDPEGKIRMPDIKNELVESVLATVVK